MKRLPLTIWRRLRRLVLRRKMRQLREEKAEMFIQRWDEACRLIWIRFYAKPKTPETMAWMQRHHGRLLQVCRNQTRKIMQQNS